jgi:hypothetical protein
MKVLSWYNQIITHFMLIALLSLNTEFANAQAAAWASIGAKWWYNSPQYDAAIDAHYTFLECTGDTIINGKSCSVISDSLFMYQENDSVFYWFNNEFRLIYDFSANVNDTIKLTYKAGIYNDSTHSVFNIKDTVIEHLVVVESIDTVLVSGKLLKRFHVSIQADSTYYFYPFKMSGNYNYTEQIGSNYFLIDEVFGQPSIYDHSIKLRCYSDNSIDEYKSDWWKTYNKACDYSLHVNDAFDDSFFTIYPNPANEIINIESSENIQSIEIYNLAGQLLIHQQLNTKYSAIDIEQLNKAVYIVKIKVNEADIQVHKFVKQ